MTKRVEKVRRVCNILIRKRQWDLVIRRDAEAFHSMMVFLKKWLISEEFFLVSCHFLFIIRKEFGKAYGRS